MESNESIEDSQVNKSLDKLKKKYNKCIKKKAEIREKVKSAKFIAANSLADKELKKAYRKEIKQYKKVRKIGLTKSLNGKKFSTTTINKIKILN